MRRVRGKKVDVRRQNVASCKELEAQLDLGLDRCFKVPQGPTKSKMEDAWIELLHQYLEQYEWEKAIGTYYRQP